MQTANYYKAKMQENMKLISMFVSSVDRKEKSKDVKKQKKRMRS